MTPRQLEAIFEGIQWDCKYIRSHNLPDFYIIWHERDSYVECIEYFNTHKEEGLTLDGFDIWRSAYLFQDSGGMKIGVTESSNDDE